MDVFAFVHTYHKMKKKCFQYRNKFSMTCHYPLPLALRDVSVIEPAKVSIVCEETEPVTDRGSAIQVKRVEYHWKLPEHIHTLLGTLRSLQAQKCINISKGSYTDSY